MILSFLMQCIDQDCFLRSFVCLLFSLFLRSWIKFILNVLCKMIDSSRCVFSFGKQFSSGNYKEGICSGYEVAYIV